MYNPRYLVYLFYEMYDYPVIIFGFSQVSLRWHLPAGNLNDSDKDKITWGGGLSVFKSALPESRLEDRNIRNNSQIGYWRNAKLSLSESWIQKFDSLWHLKQRDCLSAFREDEFGC